jgi:hypothetical protein
MEFEYDNIFLGEIEKVVDTYETEGITGRLKNMGASITSTASSIYSTKSKQNIAESKTEGRYEVSVSGSGSGSNQTKIHVKSDVPLHLVRPYNWTENPSEKEKYAKDINIDQSHSCFTEEDYSKDIDWDITNTNSTLEASKNLMPSLFVENKVRKEKVKTELESKLVEGKKKEEERIKKEKEIRAKEEAEIYNPLLNNDINEIRRKEAENKEAENKEAENEGAENEGAENEEAENEEAIYNPLLNNEIRRKLIVIISINIHGSVSLNINNENIKTISDIDVQEFPSNFKHIFWKNKGMCGKIFYGLALGFKNNIHNNFVKLINKNISDINTNYNIQNIQDKILNPGILHNFMDSGTYDPKYVPFSSDIKKDKEDIFFTENSLVKKIFTCSNNSCNPNFTKYIDKPYIDTKKYVNKNLQFDVKRDMGISIDIIDETTPSNNQKYVCKEISEILNFLDKISKIYSIEYNKLSFFNNYFEEQKINLGKNRFKLNKLIEVFGLINNYDINLFLFDYSCSGINIDEKKEDELIKFLDDSTIAKGGGTNLFEKQIKRSNKRKTIRTNKKYP